MQVYSTGDQWFAESGGGYCNRDLIPATVLGPFPARPEPAQRWRRVESNNCGEGEYVFTQFTVDGIPAFVLKEYSWSPGPGYSWNEDWEVLVPAEECSPPKLGESFRWNGGGWAPCAHPHAYPLD